MPSEPLPIDRKDLFKDRKPSSSEPVEIVQARWRESPTTPSSHPNNHGSSSCGWGGGGGPSHSRRSFTDVHTKPVGGGWHSTSVESGPGMSVDLAGQKDGKGGNFWETTASPSGNSHPHPDCVSSWDQHQLNDQRAKSNVDGVTTTGGKRLEKEISLGSSLDWKPLKWIRSGSLSSRGSGFSHSSSCKIVGVESFDAKMEAQPGNATLLPSLSGDAATCLTPKTPDEASSRKKPRLGWGEGLAKYEKKKVDPDDIVDKENAVRYGTVDGVSNSEPLLPSPYLPGKSPSLTGYSESASPTTSCSFACSLSPGLEEKTSITATTVDNDTCNPSVSSCHMSQNQSQGLTFNLENLDLTEGLNLSTSLDELMQTDVTSAPGSGFAMNKLQVWKADISRTLEITESEIDSLEHELKSLISDGGSCSYSPTSCSFLKECNNKNTEDPRHISPVDMLIEKTDDFLENSSVKDSSRESPCTASFKLVEPHSDAIEQNNSPVNLNTRSEKSESSQDHVCGNGSQVPIGSCIVSDGSAVYYGTEDKLYDSILASNKVIANRSSTEFSKILPTTDLCTSVLRATDVSLIRKKIAMRKRFLKFKERVITLKFRAFQYSWKEDLRLLSVRRVGAKSQKKLESSSRTGYNDHQKHRASIHLRLSPGSVRLVPTKEVVEHAKKLLSDSRVRTYRNVLKMPAFMLDKRERMGTRFISDNGLVENPVDVEKERSIVNPWTMEDKEMFLDKYALFGKDFRKIASFFQHKTVADCVEFYYKNHKSEEFQKTKKNSKFAKEKSCNTNTNTTYLVTSGKRLNRETGTTSLDMLGAASVMVANVDGSILERSNNIAMYCNEQETAAADVLAGICGGSISSDALGSCITSSVDHGDVHHHQIRRCQKLGGSSKRHEGSSSLNDVDEETCSDDSCGEEINSSIWTEEEKLSFIKAVKSYGKDFSKVSRCVGTRSMDQCSLFFSKTKKCFGLDVIDLGAGSEGTTGANQGSGGGGSDQDDACMVDSGSGISNDKSSVECKMEVEDLHSSDFREEHAESGRNCREPGLVLENLSRNDHEAEIKPGCRQRSSLNGNLEGAADSEAAASLEESLQITCSDSASGAKVEEEEEEEAAAKICREEELRASEHQLPSSSSRGGVNVSTARGGSTAAEDLNSASYYSRLDLNAASDNNQEAGNGLTTSNLFPQDSKRKSVSQDDVSSRLAFRKSGQRSSSIIEGYHLNLSKPCPSYSEPHTNMKLDKSLLMPRDECIQMCNDLTSDDASVSQQQQQRRRSSSLDEPTSKSGDLKLFGQIITNHSSKLQQQQPLPKANGNVQETEKPKADGGKSTCSLKFDHHRKVASLDFDQSKEYGFGVESNLQLKRSYGFWDGKRIQTGFSSLPDSAVLLAKYPAAFGGNISSTFSKLDQQQQHHSSLENGNVVSGFQTRKPTNSNRIASYHSYGQSFTVDKLLPEMPKRKELEALSSSVQQQGSRGMNVVVGACNGGGGGGGGVSDPVAAIRMHYAKTSEQYKNGGPEAWRSDIGSR